MKTLNTPNMEATKAEDHDVDAVMRDLVERDPVLNTEPVADVLDIKSKAVKNNSLPPWKQNAEWVSRNGRACTLMFPFCSIKNKKVIMDLVCEAERLLREKYPDEHSRFIDGIYRSRKLAEDEITEKQEKAARRPADIIRFPAIT